MEPATRTAHTRTRVGKILPSVTLALAGACLLAPAAATAKVFPNCKAVNKVYAHGIAKNFKVIKTANGLTGRPFVSVKQYTANQARDRDKDGIACET
jgi:Excalibur calcium-binding domain